MQKAVLLERIDTLDKWMSAYMIDQIRNGQTEKFESYDSADLIAFDWYDIRDAERDPSQVAIYYDKQNLFFICEKDEGIALASPMIRDDNTNERALYAFFAALIAKDMSALEKLEEDITDTEDDLIVQKKKECTEDIMLYRHKLLRMKRYYEQLNRIFEGLADNENGLVPKDGVKLFRILDSRIDRLFATVLNLRDYVTQVREAYQAQIDIEQNSLMKTFTVITAIFLPLSLLVGWYGMNVRMPEYEWTFGYPFVILLSLGTIFFCVWYFKKKKWF